MSWFFEKHVRQSDKNGTIKAIRNFGNWYVLVDGATQTSPYLKSMWKDAFKKFRRFNPSKVHKVLMLGLGGGGQIKTIYKTFPAVTLTVIEHDEEMIKLAKELNLYKPFPFPSMLQGEASQVLPTISDKYDLILFDLFKGWLPSQLIAQENFIKSLCDHLNPNGSLLVNIYNKDEYLEPAKKYFEEAQSWIYKLSTLGLFYNPKSI